MEMEWSRSWGGRRSLEGKKLWRPSSLVCPRHDSDTDSAVEEVPHAVNSRPDRRPSDSDSQIENYQSAIMMNLYPISRERTCSAHSLTDSYRIKSTQTLRVTQDFGSCIIQLL